MRLGLWGLKYFYLFFYILFYPPKTTNYGGKEVELFPFNIFCILKATQLRVAYLFNAGCS